MKFEEIIKKSKNVKAPDLTSGIKTNKPKSEKMESIMEQLKKVDNKTRISIRLLQLLYLILISMMSYYMFTADHANTSTGIAFIILAFFLVISVQQLRYNAYQYTYTDRPVLQFLNDAKSRMRVFTKRTWYVLPIWILIDIGLCFIVVSVFPYPQYVDDILILMQILLLGLIALDFYTAHLIWKRDNKPLVDEIDKMIDEVKIG